MSRDIDDSSENVLYDWSGREQPPTGDEADADAGPSWGAVTTPEPAGDEGASEDEESDAEQPPDAAAEAEVLDETADEAAEIEEESPLPLEDVNAVPLTEGEDPDSELEQVSQEHAVGDLDIPDGYTVLEGVADGARRAVAVVVARFNGDVTSRLLEGALSELEEAGVRQEAITILAVPGAFELPLAATALAKTRRYACVVALGCVIRGDTPHFDYVASEAASGLQLAALETGVPVSFGVLTLDRVEQADARIGKGAEAVRTALEMADVFSHLRAAAGR